jgi:hypothetical protein
LRRAKAEFRNIHLGGAAVYLATVVALTKSAGALLYTFLGGTLVALASPRIQTRVAATLVLIALFYPLLRKADMFPTEIMLNIANTINEQRASSLQTRFDQENRLLARASERGVFGWGRYGRSRVYNEDSGGDSSLTDGRWIITMGEFGVVGFLALFGTLSIPVLRATRAIARAETEVEKLLLSALSLIVALMVVEQIPNDSISPWNWLLAGALLGRVDALLLHRRQNTRSMQAPLIISNPKGVQVAGRPVSKQKG